MAEAIRTTNTQPEQKYKVTRKGNPLYIPISEFQAGDIVRIAYPPVGAMRLTENPRDKLIGRSMPKGFSRNMETTQSFPISHLRPDENGDITDITCPSSRAGYMLTYLDRMPNLV